MKQKFCGIDFGTSNSAISAGDHDSFGLIPLEGEHPTIPSAVFFNAETHEIVFGRRAIDEYMDGYTGRLMRSLKSVLGSALISEATQVGNARKSFREIIGLFLQHVKSTAEDYVDGEITRAVMGRPVHFVDHDPAADQRAEDELRAIASAQGFKEIFFEYEPIAAARAYESQLKREELVLVVDIGGGTSDFSVIRLSPQVLGVYDRSGDILANAGIRLGGTDFDKNFSMQTAMRDMGYKVAQQNGFDMPGQYYFDLSTWHLINSVYTQKAIRNIKELHYHSTRPELTQRLLYVAEHHRGHDIAGKIEKAKIALSESKTVTVDFKTIDPSWTMKVSVAQLMKAVEDDIYRIARTAMITVTEKAGLKAEQIDTIFMTGGSTALPGFEKAIQKSFPKARLHYGDRFSSVATGLGLSAAAKYGL